MLSKNQRNTATLKEASISQDNSIELTPLSQQENHNKEPSSDDETVIWDNTIPSE